MQELTDLEFHLSNELSTFEGAPEWEHCVQAAKMALVLHKAGFTGDANPFFIDWNVVRIFAGLDGVDKDILPSRDFVWITALGFLEASDSLDPKKVVVSTN